MAEQEHEGFLVSAARTLGHAAGRAAAVLGAAEPGAKAHPQAVHGRGRSGRARRIQNAMAAKQAAAALGKSAFADDVHYRRIVGKPPTIWSEEDIEYVNGLVAAGHGKSMDAA